MTTQHSQIFGLHVLKAARIAGLVGVALGFLTFIIALFVDESLVIYLDAFFSIIIYACLILIYRSDNHRWYLLFMGLNGTLIVFKFFYLLILTIIFIVRPTSYDTFPRQFSNYGNGGSRIPERLNDKSPLLGDIGGVLGTVDFNHNIGATSSIADTISGVLGTVKFGNTHDSVYDPASLQYKRPVGIGETQLSTAMKLILTAISLLFNCSSQFIAFYAFRHLKKSSIYAHQTQNTQREASRETPPLKSAMRGSTISLPPPQTTTPIQRASVNCDGRASAASRYSINTDV